jgi:hypothetical protein
MHQCIKHTIYFVYRLLYCDSYEKIAIIFNCSAMNAWTVKRTIQGFLLARDPIGSLPTVLNDPNMTEEELHQMLEHNSARQSVGIRRALSTLRTPDGRVVRNTSIFSTSNHFVPYCKVGPTRGNVTVTLSAYSFATSADISMFTLLYII